MVRPAGCAFGHWSVIPANLLRNFVSHAQESLLLAWTGSALVSPSARCGRSALVNAKGGAWATDRFCTFPTVSADACPYKAATKQVRFPRLAPRSGQSDFGHERSVGSRGLRGLIDRNGSINHSEAPSCSVSHDQSRTVYERRRQLAWKIGFNNDGAGGGNRTHTPCGTGFLNPARINSTKPASIRGKWCPRSDSNGHSLQNSILSRARLPFRHGGTRRLLSMTETGGKPIL